LEIDKEAVRLTFGKCSHIKQHGIFSLRKVDDYYIHGTPGDDGWGMISEATVSPMIGSRLSPAETIHLNFRRDDDWTTKID
jgi:hypothetical protein